MQAKPKRKRKKISPSINYFRLTNRKTVCPIFFHEYPRYVDIIKYLKNTQIDYPKNVRLEKIGKSYRRRPIYMVVLQADKKCCPKRGVMIECGIHAREWICHTTVLYMIHYILNKKKVLLKHMDFYVIPCLNPDGYEYSHTTKRLWRKNLNRNGSADMKFWGVDLNRNFPFKYGLKGSRAKPTSCKYRGQYSLSEPESISLAKAITKYSKYIKLYIAFHSYGSSILYPWGYTKKPLSDEEDLKECATAAQVEMRLNFPRSQLFKIGSIAKTKYLSSGSTLDYVRGVHHIKFAFSFELHRGGNSGFEPTTSKIISVAQETIVGIEAMIKYVRNYYSKMKSNTYSVLQANMKLDYGSGDAPTPRN